MLLIEPQWPDLALLESGSTFYDCGVGGDMRRRAEPENEWTFVLDVLKIAIGVFIGCMASVLVYEQMLVWRGEQAAKQVMQELQKQQERQKLAEQQRLEAQKERDRQKQRAMLEREWEQQQRKLAEKRKEQAWAEYFKPSAICRSDPLRKDCADEHIRQRRAFEAQYRDD